MTTRAATRSIETGSEEWAAARGTLVAVTAATGAMLAVFAIVEGQLPVVLLPVLLVAFADRLGLPDAARGAAGAAIWLLVAPHAHAEALVAPLSMATAWVAIAIGPGRFWGWVRAEWAGRESSPATPDDVGEAWIEDDLSVR